MAVAERKIDFGEWRLQPDAKYSAAIYRRRESSGGGLQPGATRQGGSGRLQGYVLLLWSQTLSSARRPEPGAQPPHLKRGADQERDAHPRGRRLQGRRIGVRQQRRSQGQPGRGLGDAGNQVEEESRRVADRLDIG